MSYENDDTFGFWKKNKKFIFGAAAGLATLVTGLKTYNAIDSGHFGVLTHMGRVVNDTIPPSVVWKIPYIESVHEFQNNTIIMETDAGTNKNTKDQNMLSSKMRLHYKIDPKQGVLALHINDMSEDNGKDYLDGLMDQSYNAVVGSKIASENIENPKGLLVGFMDNLDWRLHQNNVPISIEAAELLDATIGDGQNPYHMPIQLRIRRVEKDGKAGWTVEEMAGPAALPVESAGQIIKPNESQPIKFKDTLTLKP